jgi:hypothetical protein
MAENESRNICRAWSHRSRREANPGYRPARCADVEVMLREGELKVGMATLSARVTAALALVHTDLDLLSERLDRVETRMDGIEGCLERIETRGSI